MTARSRSIHLRVTPEEEAEIERRAGGRGRVSAWLRTLALGDAVAPDGRLEVAEDDPRRRRREPASVPGEVVVGDYVQYMHPDWGAVVGRVLRVSAEPPAAVLVQDQAPDGAREWWPLADCVRVDDP